MIVATARQSLLAFTIVLPRSDSSKIPGNVEADDGLSRTMRATYHASFVQRVALSGWSVGLHHYFIS